VELVTDASLADLDLDELLAELLDRVRATLGADTAAVLLVDHTGGALEAVAAKGLEEEVRQGIRVPIGRGFAGRVASEKRPVALEVVDPSTVYNPILVDSGIQSLLGVPLVVSGTVIGVVHVGSLVTRRFSDEDAQLLQLVADHAALAIQARLADEQRAAAATLQRSLLPGRLPDIDGLEVASRYLPGHLGDVGGDWFDLFDLPSGSIGAVIGDVVGHGLQAASVMGRFRSALRAYALESDDPADVLSRLDRMVDHFEPGQMATAFYAVISPDRREMKVSSAGHPAPVVALPDGPAFQVAIEPDPPLGLIERPRRQAVVDLPGGATLYFFTDGVIERRGEPIDAGIERLREAVVAGPPELGCTRIVARLLGAQAPDDDFALLAVSLPAGV
jgi:serine phosphatase RsbU (regulator of sigma subunit)